MSVQLAMLVDSANGAHYRYRVDYQNAQKSLESVFAALRELDRYSDAVVKVDTTSSNAARIWKANGTVARTRSGTR
jgi:hypothetical protein